MKTRKTFLLASTASLLLLAACTEPVVPEPEPEPTPTDSIPEEAFGPLTELPFSKGLNLSDWFNVSDAYWFEPELYQDKDFDQLQSLGIDVLRLPINFPAFMSGAPGYTFSNDFLNALDRAVDMAEARGIYIILDNHSYFGSRVFPESYGEELVTACFRQLASRYKNRTDKVVFELFNEPGGTYLEEHYPAMQQRLLATIRAIDPHHTIIVTAPKCSIDRLADLPGYDDDRLIYTFHFYEPFLFTHQGADWDGIALQYISGVPFPYDPGRMPPMPDEFQSQEDIDYYNNYPEEAKAEYIGKTLMEAYHWASEHDKLLFCGEFGTLTTAPASDRVQYYKTVCDYFDTFEIAWTAWEYRDTKTPNFGIFQGANVFESNLNLELIQAMGFNIPPGYEGDCPEVTFYDDAIPAWWTPSKGWDGWVPQVDFAWKENTYNGSINCIRIDFDNKWGGLTMTPWPVADLTRQHEAGASLEFAVRTTDEIDNLVVRFVQWKEGAPYQWRNMTEIGTTGGNATQNLFPADGEWHLLSIPLSDFRINGTQGQGDAWKDAPDEGEEGFAWDCINHLEFVPEGNEALLGKTLYIDDIVVRKP